MLFKLAYVAALIKPVAAAETVKYIWIPLLLLVVAVIGLVFVVWRRRRKHRYDVMLS